MTDFAQDTEHQAQAEQAAQTDENYFPNIVEQRVARRAFLKGAGMAGAATVVAPALLRPSTAKAVNPGEPLTFSPIAPSDADEVIVPEDYVSDVVIAWGDPMFADAPGFDLNAQTAEKQARQFGFNCDFVAQYPLPAWLEAEVRARKRPSPVGLWFVGIGFEKLQRQPAPRALLWVNHEYTSGSEMFPGYSSSNPTLEQVNIEIAAHGGSLLQINQRGRNAWEPDATSPFNRRITGETPITLTGPVAGSALVKTSQDPSGKNVRGMFNNCGGGVTPWGTVLTAEENFDQYFANRSALNAADPVKAALYARLPATAGATGRKWERFHPRFDVSIEPNEFARHGYIVEIDPYDPTSTPRKHTALGRFKHEAASTVLSKDKRAVVYSGDDARFEYIYKFVSKKRFNAWERSDNMDLLTEGTLYVATLNADGSGQWLPLVHGQGPLTADNGFASQAEVIINTRGAADLLGATKMDRPEDIEVSPVTNKVYVALTNNTARTTVASDAGEVAANPRLSNRWGHVVEITESRNDNGALTFAWDIFLLCGDPAAGHDVYFAGFDPSLVSPISCPDNLDFDAAGNLWIATDGAPATPAFTTRNDGIFAVPTEGEDRGYLRQFLSGVKGCEVASLKHSTDGKTLFATIQHPGEGNGLPNTESSWPDGTNNPPRGAVVAVRHVNGRSIGR